MKTQELFIASAITLLGLVVGNELMDGMNQPQVYTPQAASPSDQCIAINQKLLGLSSPEAMSHIEQACR